MPALVGKVVMLYVRVSLSGSTALIVRDPLLLNTAYSENNNTIFKGDT
jgi:hypothetical protein